MAVQTGYDKLTVGKRPKAVWQEHNNLWKKVKMAMDAKGDDFVIVSHVKGHANEPHIALGQATWKEAEANNQADIRAAKGAKEHAISEMVTENYKINGQQPKIMQRMLIAIYKERRNTTCCNNLKRCNRQMKNLTKTTTHGHKTTKGT